MVSTIAGNGTMGYLDGPSSLAQFNSPTDICDDGFGNIYVSDKGNYRVRLINLNINQGKGNYIQCHHNKRQDLF